MVDDIRERKTTKRTPRGKIKTKTKYRVRRYVKVRLALRQSDTR